MYFGKMVELATADELFKNPLHPYTRSLLSAIPLPDPVYEKSRQRITYNPLVEHDYTEDKPSFREVSPGHFVMCNEAEFKKYQSELK
jgi:oligopeptide transport system ATP-binding protein